MFKRNLLIFAFSISFTFFLSLLSNQSLLAINNCTNDITDLIYEPGIFKYYQCPGNSNVYLNDNMETSSFFSTGYKTNFLYRKNDNEGDVYYVRDLHIVAKGYDDGVLFQPGNNKWIKVYKDSSLIFDGFFRDILGDQSYTNQLPLYTEPGVYLIEQYVQNGQFSFSINVHVISEKSTNYLIKDAKIDTTSIFVNGDLNRVINNGSNLNMMFNIYKSNLGINSEIILNINGNNVISNVFAIDENYIVYFSRSQIIQYLNTNTSESNPNVLTLTLTNALDNKRVYVFRLLIAESKVSIKLNSIVEEGPVSSKKITIVATAGYSNILDENSFKYFWSRDPSIALNKNSFMLKYDDVEYKGSYVNGSGVIIREKSGNYYLYALAEDNVSSVVVRSDVINLQKSPSAHLKITSESIIFTFFVLVVAFIPIAVYTFISKKKIRNY